MKGKIYNFTVIIISLLIFVQHSSYAQNNNTLNELEIQYKNTNDSTVQISLIHQIIQITEAEKPHIAFKYAQEAEKITPKIEDKPLLIQAYQDIAIGNYVNGNQDKAESYANQSINLSQEENYKKGVVKGLNLLSNFYRKKDVNRAYNFVKQALFVSKEGEVNGAGLVEACKNIMEINAKDTDLANYIKEARKYIEQVEEPKILADFYSNAGNFELSQENYTQTVTDYENALENNLVLDSKRSIVENLLNLGKVNSNHLNQENKGIEYLFQAYIIAQEYDFEGNGKILHDIIQNIAITYENLEVQTKDKHKEKSEEYGLLKKSYVERSKVLTESNYKIPQYLRKLYGTKLTYGASPINNANNRNDDALSAEIDRQRRIIENLGEANNILEIASKKAKLQHAEDSILVLKKNKTIAELRADLEDKTLENNSLRTAQKNHQKEIQNTRSYWLFWLVLALVLGILSASFLIYRNRKNEHEVYQQKTTLNNYYERINKQEKELRESQDKIRLKQEQLASTHAKLDDAHQQNIAIQQVLVQELKEPIEKIVVQTQEEEPTINRLLIHQSGKQMLNLLTSIEDIPKYENAKIQLFKESNAIYKVAKQAIKENELLIKEQGIEIENNIKPYLYANFDKEIILKVFYNYLANCLKYTELGGKIILDAKPVLQGKEPFIKITITDNGRIVPANLQEQTYQKFSIEEARPSSLGLVFNKLVIEEHQGKVGIDSNETTGNTFFFTLPESMEEIDFQEVFDQKTEEEVVVEKENVLSLDENNPTDKVVLQLDIDSKQLLKPFLKKFAELEYFETSSLNAILRDIHFEGNAHIQQWKKAMQNAIYYVDEEKYKRLMQM